MATMLPPVYGAAFEFDVVLFDADGAIKTTPTIASGDFVLSKSNGSTANLTTTPSESPASSGIVRVQLSATEMEADKLTVKWHDASGAEWTDGAVVIFTSGQTLNAMDSILDDILTDTGTTLDTLIKDIPTNSEFEARTLLAADYFDPATDTVANVTTVGSVTGAVGSVTGAVGSVTGAVGSVTGNVGGNVAGSVGSVTGAVGSVTGNVGGNVTGSVGSVAAGGITAASVATGAIDADALAADAVTEIQAGLATAAAVADIPTNAELAAALASADDAVLAAVAALNNLDAAGIRTAVGLATANLDTQLAALPTATENADAVLSRGVAHVEDTAEFASLAELILGAFESAAVGTTWTITKTDGVTTFNTRTLTTDAAAEPITSVT